MKAFFIGCCVVGVMMLAPAVFAAPPTFMASWHAQTYVPSWYQGKPMVVENSSVVVGFEILNDQGKVINISNNMVRWYVDSDLVRSGNGMQQLTVSNTKVVDSDIDVRMSVEYNDLVEGRTYFTDHYITIPVQRPKVVLAKPIFGGVLFTNASLLLRVFPFFFSVPNETLSVDWSIGNQHPEVSENPFSLLVSLGNDVTGGSVTARVSVRNNQDAIQTASDSQVFRIQ